MRRAVMVLALAACGGGGESPVPDVAGDTSTPVDTVGPEMIRQVDILFVIGDSPSMLDRQQSLQDNYPNMMNVLQTLGGGLPNVHIGVVSADLGVTATTSTTPGPPVGSGPGECIGEGKAGHLSSSSMVSGNFLVDVKNTDGSRTTNYTGRLDEAFPSMANLGASGCRFQQPLEAMKRALSPSNPTNEGFLRPDALLAIVFVLSEDDCSMVDVSLLGSAGGPLGPLEPFRCTRFGVTCDIGGLTDAAMNQNGVKDQCHPNDNSTLLAKVSTYVDFLKGLKADPSRILVAGILGDNAPFEVELRTVDGSPQPALAHSCVFEGPDGILNTSDDQAADPAIRVSSFLFQFPERATQTTICQADLSGAFQLIAESVE